MDTHVVRPCGGETRGPELFDGRGEEVDERRRDLHCMSAQKRGEICSPRTMTPLPKYFAVSNTRWGTRWLRYFDLRARTGKSAPASEPARMMKIEAILRPVSERSPPPEPQLSSSSSSRARRRTYWRILERNAGGRPGNGGDINRERGREEEEEVRVEEACKIAAGSLWHAICDRDRGGTPNNSRILIGWAIYSHSAWRPEYPPGQRLCQLCVHPPPSWSSKPHACYWLELPAWYLTTLSFDNNPRVLCTN